MYSECSSGATIYKVLNMEQLWNVAELSNPDDLSSAITDLKATNISIPQVNLTNDDLNAILNTLEDALNPTVLNITKLIDGVSGSIILPDLRDIRDAAAGSPGGVDLSADVRKTTV